MLNHDGGVIDDLITYYLGPDRYRVIVNAATRDKDMAWMNEQAKAFDVVVSEREELAMIAVQGPEARERAAGVLDDQWRDKALALKPFYGLEAGDLFIARTGYTGEDGWEIVLPADQAADFWARCVDAGIRPCGLGARDTLRLEAGMNLYGSDMTETTSPLISGLGWTIAWEPAERDFIGRAALQKQRDKGVEQKLVGLILQDKGILRGHQKVIVEDAGEGETTSGSFSPTLKQSIAFARVPKQAGDHCQVEIRGKLLNAKIVKPVFVRDGKPV